jgi:hypothetical protein
MPKLLRNSTSYLGVFVLALLVWTHLITYWRRAFMLDRTFDSGAAVIGWFWGFDFLVALVAGFALTLLLRASRPLVWTAALGLGFMLLRIRFTRYWIGPEADWTIYLEDYGLYFVPLVGALAGGSLAQWFDRGSTPAAAPNNRWRGQ